VASWVASGFPPGLGAIGDRCPQRDPSRRFASGESLHAALLKAGREEEAARVLATSAGRLSGLDHVDVPAYLATTCLGEAEIALRQGRADLAYSRCRQVVDGWRDGARRMDLGILRSAAGLGFGTIFQGGPAVAWMAPLPLDARKRPVPDGVVGRSAHRGRTVGY
jgi:hypothetical protein